MFPETLTSQVTQEVVSTWVVPSKCDTTPPIWTQTPAICTPPPCSAFLSPSRKPVGPQRLLSLEGQPEASLLSLQHAALLLKTRSLGMSGIWTLCLPLLYDGVDYISLDSALLWNYLLPLLTTCSCFSLVLAPRSLSVSEQGSFYHPVILLSDPSTLGGRVYTS